MDCRYCPSYMTGADAAKYIGKDPGVPVCARFGRLLAKHGMTPSQVDRCAQTFADTCEAFGHPAPNTKPDFIEALVAAPLGRLPTEVGGIPKRIDLGVDSSGRFVPEAPTSCAKCVNFVKPDVMNDEMGWKAGMCAAKGRLIFPNRYSREPVGCEYGVDGEPRDTTEGIIEMPIYNTAFTVTENTNPVSAWLSNGGKWQEPSEYETDSPVAEDEAKFGIRAWRLIVNPLDPRKYTYLPIFSPDVFTADERDEIPHTGDDEHPEWYVDHGGLVYSIAAEWMGLDETPLLHGRAGVGKTDVFRHLAWMMQVPFVRISITGSTDIDDLAGHDVFRDGETRWVDGRLSKWYERVAVCVIDEFNCGRDEVDQFLRPLTDNSRQYALDMSEGQKKTRNPFFFLGFTQNPDWDPMNIGTRPLSDAAGNRLAHIYVDLPPAEIERAILVQRCVGGEITSQIPTVTGKPGEDAQYPRHRGAYVPDGETLDKVMSIANEIRSLVDQGALPISWGLRPQIAVLRKTEYYDLVTAYRRAVTDRLEPSTRQQILDIVATMEDTGAMSASNEPF